MFGFKIMFCVIDVICFVYLKCFEVGTTKKEHVSLLVVCDLYIEEIKLLNSFRFGITSKALYVFAMIVCARTYIKYTL